MDKITEYKLNKLREMDEEIDRKAAEIGWNSGDGVFETLSRLSDGTASDIEKRRAERAPLAKQVEVMKLLHDRSKLQRAYFYDENDPMNEPVSLKELFGIEVVK